MKLTIDFDRTIGAIKPVHGVGQPPFQGTNFSMFRYLSEAGIPFSRLHDVGGPYGGFRWVDIPNIFRDFNADPDDVASYDFTFTDMLITALVKSGVEPFFRLGVTIENDAMIKSYRLDPPADPHKWARICEMIIRHYTEGWADGFRYDIRYWEIWNEPDNYETPEENQMWKGNAAQYYELYEVASKHLKSCFPHLKIGGYASCGFYSLLSSFVAGAKSTPRFDYFIEFFDGFLKHIKTHDCPLDFFSWHSYDDIEKNKHYARYARRRLDEAGYTNTEISCNEWNVRNETRGSFEHAAHTCGMMLTFQDLPVDTAMFYDARFGTSIYGALFNPLTAQPLPTYYAFTAFNRLYALGDQVALTSDDADGVYAVAAKKEKTGCVVIGNTNKQAVPLCIDAGVCASEWILTANGEIEQPTAPLTELPAESILCITYQL